MITLTVCWSRYAPFVAVLPTRLYGFYYLKLGKRGKAEYLQPLASSYFFEDKQDQRDADCETVNCRIKNTVCSLSKRINSLVILF
ncbi:DNA-directed RNA polymerase subunit omega [Enterobacter hormaechei ATCC 49162]|nr:DNA-directed RNA polymerase subunit omega [Enterobacter hormaechei ATCC 49162]